MRERLRNRVWPPAVLVCILLVAGSLLVTSIYLNLRRQLVQQHQEQLLVMARSAASNLQSYLGSYQKDFSLLKASSDFREGVAHYRATGDGSLLLDCLDTYNYATEDYVADISLTDREGRVLVGTGRHGPYQSITPAGQDLVVARDRDGRLCLAISTGVDGDYRLQSMVDVAYMYRDTAAFMTIGERGFVSFQHSGGIVLAHPDAGWVGLELAEASRQVFPTGDHRDMETLAARQRQGGEDIVVLSSYWWDREDPSSAKVVAAYSTAVIGDDFLTATALADYQEIMAAANQGILGIGAVLVLVMAFFCFLTLQLYTAIRDKSRVERENAYLRELNSTLEEMHRSEEKLQHFQRLQIIGTLTGGIAHELGNLLVPIMAYSAMMADQVSPQQEELYDEAQEIYSAAAKAKEVIGQITAISRKDRETAFRELDLRQTVASALKMADSAKPQDTAIEWRLELEGRKVLGSATQLCQVVLNLCTNAFHAMAGRSDGRLVVTGTIRPGEGDAGETAVLTFADNGAGIEKHVLERIFDPFFTTKRAGEGTGLGLSIVQSIVESHQGSITAESRPGEGSVFTLTLPVILPREDLPSPAARGEGAPVLLLEEDPKIARMLASALRSAGYRVESCTRGEDAMAWLRREQDLALFICGYPPQGGTGQSAIRLVCSTRPRARVLVLTGFVDRELVESSHKGIIDAFLIRPVSLPELLQKAEELVGQNKD